MMSATRRQGSIIKQYEYVLHSCANLLIEEGKIGQEEFEALFNAPTAQ